MSGRRLSLVSGGTIGSFWSAPCGITVAALGTGLLPGAVKEQPAQATFSSSFWPSQSVIWPLSLVGTTPHAHSLIVFVLPPSVGSDLGIFQKILKTEMKQKDTSDQGRSTF